MKEAFCRMARPSLFALLTLGVATPLSAETDLTVSFTGAPGTVTRSTAVETADLQLGTTAGRAALDQRIAIAARKVCGYSVMHGLRPHRDYQRCFDEATSHARADMASMRGASH